MSTVHLQTKKKFYFYVLIFIEIPEKYKKKQFILRNNKKKC